MNKKLNLNNILLFSILILLFEPIICIKYDLLNISFILGSVFSLLITLYIYFKKGILIDKAIYLIILMRVLFLIPTLLYPGGDLLKWGYLSLIVITLILILNYSCKKSYKKTIEILTYIFFIYAFLNLLSYLFLPNGLYQDKSSYQILYFLGIRTRFTDYAFIGLVLSNLNYKINNCNKKIFYFMSIVCILNMVLPKISTALVAIAVFYFTMFLLSKKNMKKLVTYNNVLIGSIALNLSIVLLNIQKSLNWLFLLLFNKTANLTGRTEIWEKSYEVILKKPILGYGVRNDGSFIYIRDKYWQAHNQLLQLMYDGGIVGLILFIVMLFVMGISLKFKNDKNDNVKYIFIAGLFGIFMIMITEINSYYIPYYLLLFLAYYLKDYREDNENEQN